MQKTALRRVTESQQSRQNRTNEQLSTEIVAMTILGGVLELLPQKAKKINIDELCDDFYLKGEVFLDEFLVLLHEIPDIILMLQQFTKFTLNEIAETADSLNSRTNGTANRLKTEVRALDKGINLTLPLLITCLTGADIYFLQQMIVCLQKSMHFQAKAELVIGSQGQEGNCKVSWEKRINQYRIVYSIELILDPNEVDCFQLVAKFELVCREMHQIMKQYMKRFALKNKISYWISRFQQRLSKRGQQDNLFIPTIQNNRIIIDERQENQNQSPLVLSPF